METIVHLKPSFGRPRLAKPDNLRGLDSLTVLPITPFPHIRQGIRIGNQTKFRRLMDEFASCIPVLDDPSLGVQTDKALFSDTPYHLNAEGAKCRTVILASSLAKAL